MPESVQKKRARDEKRAKAYAEAKAKGKADRKAARAAMLTNAEKYQKAYDAARKSEVDQRRAAKKAGNFFVPAESKIALIVRIKGINRHPPKVRKILQLLRLRQLNNAVFVKINKATINMLYKVQSCITYGYPSRKTIRDLIYKRGYGKVNGNRIPLTDNSVVSGSLSKEGVNSVEDLINELYSVGPNFKKVNNFVWPFKLNSPKGGFSKKRHAYHQGGDWGNREDKINNLVKQML